MIKKITGAELLAAMEKNGLPIARTWRVFDDRYNKVKAACILGQAGINLGYNVDAFAQAVSRMDYSFDPKALILEKIMQYNDRKDALGEYRTYEEVLKYAQSLINPDDVFELNFMGNVS